MPLDIHGIDPNKPGNILRPDEQIVFVLKRHWIAYVYLGIYAFFLIFSLFLFLIYRSSVFSFFPEAVFSVFLVAYLSV